MGFGLLFFGYFATMLMSVNQFGAFIKLAGYALILIASCKLNKYHGSFLWLSISSVLMMAVYVAMVASNVSQFLYEQLIIDVQPLGQAYQNICSYIEAAATFVFHAAMLSAIRAIAVETGVFKNAVSAVRNLVFVCLYYVLYLLAMLPLSISKYFSLAAVVVFFVFIILNLVLIYSCYARICDECDVEMEQKPSRFAFVNKMRQEAAERQRQNEQRQAEYKSKRQKNRRKQ